LQINISVGLRGYRKKNRLSIFFTLPEEECAKYGYNIGAVPFTWKKCVNVKLIKRV
jgi:hypothetical protein